jgi:hypothetical protein
VSDSGRSHCFFSWGGGGGEEEAPGQVLLSRFRRTTRAFKQPHLCYILYIEQRRFHCCMLQAISKSALDLDALGSARALFRLRQPDDLVYASIYVKGLLLLVPPPRSCVYVAYAHAFYVVMCYMSITCICQLYVLKCYMSLKCYVSVMCLVLATSCICICLLYVVICYMSLKCYMSVICLV